MEMTTEIRKLTDSLEEADSHDEDHDYSFPWDILRISPFGSLLRITVEVLVCDEHALYFGRVPTGASIGDGLAIEEGALIMFTQQEQDAIEGSEELHDYRKECFYASMDEKADQAEMEREFVRDAQCRGWAR